MTDQPSIAKEQAEIRDVLARINGAWSKLRGEAMTAALNECFADEIVMRGPGFVFLGKGRDVAVASYQDFVSQAEVKDFLLDEPQVDVAGDTATAQYKWTMTYILNGQEYTERGHDLFVFARKDRKWLAVWRALLPEQAEIAS
jgi:ketosteroid isomerase-like protein